MNSLDANRTLNKMGDFLAWIGAGFVLPCTGLAFYRKAIFRKTGTAVLFFMLFSFCIACLMTFDLGLSFSDMAQRLFSRYQSGVIPELVITDGVAQVNGEEPFVFAADGIIVIFDTTGTYSELDKTAYRRGFLFTRTEFHYLNGRNYHVQPYTDFHLLLNTNSIIINGDTIQKPVRIYIGVLTCTLFIIFIFWKVFLSFGYLAFFAVILWGIVSLKYPGTNFKFVLISGIYAYVPSQYIANSLRSISVSFLGLQTLLLLLIWVPLVYRLLKENRQPHQSEEKLHLKPALIGIPFLLAVSISYVSGSMLKTGIMFLVLALTAYIFLMLKKSKPEFLVETISVQSEEKEGDG